MERITITLSHISKQLKYTARVIMNSKFAKKLSCQTINYYCCQTIYLLMASTFKCRCVCFGHNSKPSLRYMKLQLSLGILYHIIQTYILCSPCWQYHFDHLYHQHWHCIWNTHHEALVQCNFDMIVMQPFHWYTPFSWFQDVDLTCISDSSK